jgi:alpha-tubulin suppressor-like RCC1 family protein
VDLHGSAEQISAGFQDACAVLRTGSVDCWGAAASGALGIGKGRALKTCVGTAERNDQQCVDTPTPAAGLGDALVVSAGVGGTCIRTDGGAADCWGDNQTGQLGDGGNGGPLTCVTATGEQPCSMTPQRVAGLA